MPKKKDEVLIKVTRRDAGRLLALVRERKRRLKKGIDKFGDDFDPKLGANMIEGLEAFTELLNVVQDSITSAGE